MGINSLSYAPFVFSSALALISPLISRLWKAELRNDAEELEEEGLISEDITDEFVNFAEKSLGAVQMSTALLVTMVSGAVQLVYRNQTPVWAFLILMLISVFLFYKLFTRDPHVYASFRGIPYPRSAVYTLVINVLFIASLFFLGG
jgi:hypothetical protein